MDAMSVMIFSVMSLALYGCSMMCRDLIARKAPRETMAIYIIVIVGSAAILLIDAPNGYGWHTAAWIIFVIVFGWFTHRFVGS